MRVIEAEIHTFTQMSLRKHVRPMNIMTFNKHFNQMQNTPQFKGELFPDYQIETQVC